MKTWVSNTTTPVCPNGRDEAWCRPDQLLSLLPVVAIFLAASLGAWGTDTEETEARNSSGTAVETPIVDVLKALLRSTTSTTTEEEKEEVEAVDQLRRSDQVELVKVAHKMNRTSSKRIFQKTVASVFKSESEERRAKLRAIRRFYETKRGSLFRSGQLLHPPMQEQDQHQQGI